MPERAAFVNANIVQRSLDGFVLPRTQDLFFGGDYISTFEKSNRVTLPLAPIGLWNVDSASAKCLAIPQEAFSVYIDGTYTADKIDLDIHVIPEISVLPF